MQNSMRKNKVKTFRINRITQYKLTKLKENWNISEGKTIEIIIDAAYYKLFGDHQWGKELTKEERELIEIANTPWVYDYKSR